GFLKCTIARESARGREKPDARLARGGGGGAARDRESAGGPPPSPDSTRRRSSGLVEARRARARARLRLTWRRDSLLKHTRAACLAAAVDRANPKPESAILLGVLTLIFILWTMPLQPLNLTRPHSYLHPDFFFSKQYINK